MVIMAACPNLKPGRSKALGCEATGQHLQVDRRNGRRFYVTGKVEQLG
jgi:hypothetical protein